MGHYNYIHVVDLVMGHLCALDKLEEKSGINIWNLGTGNGVSVLEVVSCFEAVTGHEIPYSVASRRNGDIAICWADSSKAKKELNWYAVHDLKKMISDTWKWQTKNPRGYEN